MSARGPLRLLIVEDSEKDARLIVRELERHGFAVSWHRVQAERELTEALASEPWQAALVDHSLPGFSGPAALGLIRERDPDLPLIMISGTIGEEVAVECMKAGAHDYLMKDNLLRLGPALERELREADLRRERRRNEQAVRDSAREWRTTFDGVSSPVAVLDRETRFVRCNQAMRRFLGRSLQDILGRTCAELIRELSCTATDCPLCRMWETGSAAGAVHRLRERWFEVTAEPVPGEGDSQQRAVLVLRDVTEQRESLHFLQSLMDTLPTPVYFQDLQGVFRLCNRCFLQALGLAREQVIGHPGAEFLPASLAEILERFHRELRQSPGSQTLETRLELADGRPHEFLLALTSYRGPQGDIQGVLGQASDITETRRAEERFRTLFEGAADALFIHDSEGRLLEANTEACSRLGYTRNELLDMSFRQIEAFEQAGLTGPRLQQVIHQGHALFQTSYRARDGSIIPTEVSARLLKLQGQPVILSTARDISERRRAEQERDRLEAMVRQSQKLEAIGQLAAGVAHDFNNLLTAILGYSDILLRKLEPGANQEFVRQIQAACRRASSLTQGLLAFGRKQPYAPRPMQLNAWLAGMQDFFRRLLREDVELEIQPAAEPLPLQADEAQLEQVLLNLLTNARDAMPGGGRITVSTSRQAGQARITVSDTGTGMDEATRAKIFDPFFTTKEPGKGTGLGLAVVWGIIQRHKGSIEVQSEPGRGTTFQIRLPLSAGIPEPEGSPENPALLRGHETVLLAEDEEALRALLTAGLRDAGYEVLSAMDGRQAMELYVAEQNRIAAVVLDIVMPQATGEEVLLAIRARRSDLPVLLISGHLQDTASLERGAGASLLRKPFTVAELLHRLREVLDA
jgi:two-component system cell cycle sensor histidine kinase/response regulator CckA